MKFPTRTNGPVKDVSEGKPKQLILYLDFIAALINNDDKTVSEIMDRLPLFERHTLLNNSFNFNEIYRTGLKHFHGISFTPIRLPTHIAIAFCSRNMVKLLVSTYEADISQVDLDYGNVLHSCVLAAFIFSDLEKKICRNVEWLFSSELDQDIQNLLFQENRYGFRPIEYAAQQGCLVLMRTLLEVTFTEEQDRGLDVYRLHDVTEYEDGSRHSKSPMSMLAFLDQKKLKERKTSQVIFSPIISNWIEAKITSNYTLITLSCLLRLLFLSGFYMIDSNSNVLRAKFANQTSEYLCPGLGIIRLPDLAFRILSFAMITYHGITLCIVYVQLFLFLRYKRYMRSNNFYGKKKVIPHTTFFFIVNVVMMMIETLVVLEYMFVYYDLPEIGALKSALLVARGLLPLLVVWVLGYFLQFWPLIGPAIITLLAMLIPLVKFIVLFIIVLLPFTQLYAMFVFSNSTSGCVELFNSPQMTFLTLFNAIFFNVDILQIPVKNKGIFLFYNFLLIFTVGIVLISFLIATMTSSAVLLHKNKEVIMKISQLAAAIHMEDRSFWFCKILYRFIFRRLGFHCANGRIFIASTTFKFKGRLRKKHAAKK